MRDRAWHSTSLTALWASLIVTAPALLVGVRLTAAVRHGGVGLTLSQLILAVPLGVVAGAGLLYAVAWSAAYYGVPGTLLVRPAVGVTGSWVFGAARVAFVIGWTALSLQVAGAALGRGLAGLGVAGETRRISILAAAVLAAVMVAAGPMLVTRLWIRRFAFWAALVAAGLLAWQVLGSVDMPALMRQPSEAGFFLGVDGVVAFAVVWIPIIADTARFASDESTAGSSAGYSFAVAALVMVVAGGLMGLLAVRPTVGNVLAEAEALFPASVAGVAGLLWAVASEGEQSFAFAYSGSSSVQSLVWRLPGRLLGLAVVAAGAALAVLVAEGTLTDYLDLLLAVIGSLAAVFLADMFMVRRGDYEIDGMYDRRGQYAGFNGYGLMSFAIGFLLTQWLHPTGPEGWVAAVQAVSFGEESLALSLGIPPTIVGMVFAFGTYALLGRWRIRQRVYVSKLRL